MKKRFCPCGCGELVSPKGYCDDVLDAANGSPDLAREIALAKRNVLDCAAKFMASPKVRAEWFAGGN